MPSLCAILGFTALALASPILKHALHIVITPLELPSNGEIVHGIVSRGLIATPPIAAFQASPKAETILNTNTTAQGSASSAFPSHVSSTLPQQSRWGPGAISSVFFGCVASILGAIGVRITYSLYRRQSRTQESDELVVLGDSQIFEPSNDDDAVPLEDLPPADLSVNASAGSLGQQGIRSPVTLHL
ncbi:hypothetical protein MMC29_007048 [Sticta canariensis]|nr:hypothetical protein [Sticta canariensis]